MMSAKFEYVKAGQYSISTAVGSFTATQQAERNNRPGRWIVIGDETFGLNGSYGELRDVREAINNLMARWF
jgi:hypothetical protein